MGFLFFPSVIPKLKKRGLTVIGWADWYGHNWGPIHNPTPYGTDGHPDDIDSREAEEFGREMVWRSQRIYAGEISLIPREPTPVSKPDFGVDSIMTRLHFSKISRKKCVA